jgi:hypothetical protein
MIPRHRPAETSAGAAVPTRRPDHTTHRRNYPATVDRRTVASVLIGAVVALLFAAIATSGAVPLADGPPRFLGDLEATPNVIEVEIESEPGEEVEREQREPSPLVEAIVRTVFYAVLVVGAVLAASYLWRHRPSFTWRRRRRRAVHDVDVLADVVAAVAADATAQQVALRRGRPRSAIVECWLRLEAAVAAAGVERSPADTSSELTERVLAGHAVDARAIGRLAALYREARFSDHEMGEDERQAAIAALDAVHDGLRRAPVSAS